jgi:hypothetical protein
MAGFLVCAIALMVDPQPKRRLAALVPIVAATAMRWNAMVATLPLVLLLFHVGTVRGVRRYAIALAAWLGTIAIAFALNALLTTRHVHYWYRTQAYQDIAATIEQADLDDTTIARVLDGVPLLAHDNLHERFHAAYDPSDYRQLVPIENPRDDAMHVDPILIAPRDASEREAIAHAWRELVFGHPAAYLRYRWANFRELLRIDRRPLFAHVYVWFAVVAAPWTVDEMDHDAAPSRVQDAMREGSIRLSRTPLYWPWLYLVASGVLIIAWRRHRLEAALLASGVLYELAWFFLNPTGDFRYSQWLVTCVALACATRIAARVAPIPVR